MKRDKRALHAAYIYVKRKQGLAAAVWAFDGYRYDPASPPAPRCSSCRIARRRAEESCRCAVACAARLGN